MFEIKELIPQNICLACQGCCRYRQAVSSWSPFFLPKEAAELIERKIVDKSVFQEEIGKDAPVSVKLSRKEDFYICPFLEYSSNKCVIYNDRPLECRLYPFLLIRTKDAVSLAIDENCPYAKEILNAGTLKETLDYLMAFFASEEFKKSTETLFKNSEAIYPPQYHAEFKILADLP